MALAVGCCKHPTESPRTKHQLPVKDVYSSPDCQLGWRRLCCRGEHDTRQRAPPTVPEPSGTKLNPTGGKTRHGSPVEVIKQQVRVCVCHDAAVGRNKHARLDKHVRENWMK